MHKVQALSTVKRGAAVLRAACEPRLLDDSLRQLEPASPDVNRSHANAATIDMLTIHFLHSGKLS
jgi:hypothetical protein